MSHLPAESTDADPGQCVAALARLHELAMTRPLELRPALAAVLETAVDVHGAKQGVLSVFDPAAGDFTPWATAGFDPAASETDAPVQSTPILTRSGELLGVLSLHLASPRNPTRLQVQLADLCARQAGLLIEAARSQEAVRESERRYRELVHGLPAAIYMTDAEGNVTLYNEAAVRLWGREPQPEVDRWCGSYKMYWPDGSSLPLDQCPMAIALKEGRSLHGVEAVVERPDGTRRDVLVYPQLNRDASGAIIGATNTMLDVTDRKQAERIRERLAEAQRLESIGLLAGGIAHDFNNILVGVLGNASLAADVLEEGHPAKALVKGIERAGERAAHLTRQMLAYAGKGQFIIEEVDLSDTARESLSLVLPSISKRIRLEIELAAGLPAFAADRSQVQQVVMNLILNAAEAIGDGPGALSIRTDVRQLSGQQVRNELAGVVAAPGLYVCIEVRDTGCGMDEETRRRIFEPFFTTKFTGRGLGLAALAGIVRGHKGIVEVASAPGQGTTFRVMLPVSGEPAAAAHPPAQPRELRGSAGVLIVDDEDVVLQTAKVALERQGYRVFVANSGRAALDLLETEGSPVHLVLLDVNMPGLGGHETLAAIQSRRPGLKAVVSSGYSETEALRTFPSQDVAGFIQKPYSGLRLAETVKSALQRAA